MLTINIRICIRWRLGGWKKKETGREEKERKSRALRNSFFKFMERERERLRCQGRFGTAANYLTAKNSFRAFLEGRDLSFGQLSRRLMADYQDWLRRKGISPNTSSCYMRALRAVYNKAVDEGLTRQAYPFKGVYTGVEKTRKRNLGEKILRDMERLRPVESALRLARDLFLFSFLACGMPFVDMAFLKKEQLREGYLVYRRHKTGKQVVVKLDNRMYDIIQRYERSESPYLFPVVRPEADAAEAYRQYRRGVCRYNRLLKRLGRLIGCPASLSSYAARHSWASQASANNVGLGVISKALGHTQLRTTQVYINDVNDSAVERANRRIMRKVFGKTGEIKEG